MIPFARYRCYCQAVEALGFPRYAGSTWRGAFGHALKRTVCITSLRNCCECLLWRSCAYSYLFETPPPKEAVMLRKYPAAPHPFLIHPEATNAHRYEAGEVFSVDLTLIGRAVGQLPYVIYALSRAGTYGIGRGRGRFALEQVSQHIPGEGFRLIYSAGGNVSALPAQAPIAPKVPDGICTLVLTTPLRIQHQERLMREADFSFRGLMAALFRRLSLLSYFHGNGPIIADFRSLLAQAEAVRPVSAELAWYDWERYSNRQKTYVRMGGLVGQVSFEGRQLAPFWPWLWAGQAVHVGKGTVMGLGGYRIEAASLPEAGFEDRNVKSNLL
ncbi:MAG: CRISPR system precrRNA processing endoribonuclease RAMP protein Cas6 [Methylohalobius sp.]